MCVCVCVCLCVCVSVCLCVGAPLGDHTLRREVELAPARACMRLCVCVEESSSAGAEHKHWGMHGCS